MLQPKDRMAEWIQKQTHIYAVNKRLTSDLKTQTESEGWKKVFHANGIQKKARVAILI